MKEYQLQRLAKSIVADLASFVLPICTGTVNAVNELLDDQESLFLIHSPKYMFEYYKNIPGTTYLKVPISRGMIIPPVVLDSAISSPISPEHINLKKSKTNFVLDPTVDGLTSKYIDIFTARAKYRKQREPRNDKLLRIAAIKGGRAPLIELHETSYFMHIRTNLMMDYKDANSKSLRDIHHNNRRLEPLGQSGLSDHLGVDTLLFTSDQQLILSMRGEALNVTPGMLGPSGAGALKSSDWPSGADTAKMSDFKLDRETLEELGLVEEEILSDRTLVLGIGRDLIRGGKPQLFLSAQTKCTATEILESWKGKADTHWEHKHLEAIPLPQGFSLDKPDRSLIEPWIEGLFLMRGSEMTQPLQGLLAAWLHHMPLHD